MAPYRTQTKIIADILTTARDMNTGGDGVGITMLLRKGNVSYSRMTKLITDLVGAGLLVELNLEKSAKYKISDKGISFLHAYGQFEDFAQSFGLKLKRFLFGRVHPSVARPAQSNFYALRPRVGPDSS